MLTKRELRSTMKARLAAQRPEDRARRSRAIAERLVAHPAYRAAATLCLFASLPEEVDTAPIVDRALADGKRVLLPRTDLAAKRLDFFAVRDRARDLAPGTLGIPEPVAGSEPADAREAGLVIVPGVAFDREGNRLGHGAALYDRFLAGLAPAVPKIGLAYSFQIVDRVPTEAYDVRLDAVLTD